MIGFKTFMAKIREVLMEHLDIKTTRRCFLNKALNKNQLYPGRDPAQKPLKI